MSSSAIPCSLGRGELSSCAEEELAFFFHCFALHSRLIHIPAILFHGFVVWWNQKYDSSYLLYPVIFDAASLRRSEVTAFQVQYVFLIKNL